MNDLGENDIMPIMEEVPSKFKMTSEEQLLLHQLKIADWFEHSKQKVKKGKKTELPKKSLPSQWNLASEKTLYEWQKDCTEKWFTNNYSGTVKVITGAGKTRLALHIVTRLHNSVDPDLRVVIIVPTIVLMHQWYDEILDSGNIPEEYIGRLGGGYQDDLSDGKRILIAVLVSASKKLEDYFKKDKIANNTLVIADECHRAGAQERKSIFNVKFKYTLGLSATPERYDEKYNESELASHLGNIIYELTYAQALELGIIPPFKINHYALALKTKERTEYEKLSRSINNLKQELSQLKPDKKDFWEWVRRKSVQNGELAYQASKLQRDIARRKALLFGMEARTEMLFEILDNEFRVNSNAQVLLFHESIQNAMSLYFKLKEKGYPVIVEHSQLPKALREAGLNLFRKGDVKILVSVKSLIEGFNVPAVDMGIIVASSSSVRQRIQSMGRVMRKHKGQDGEENTSRICVFYAHKTVEESIYRKLDWENILGAEANEYYLVSEKMNLSPLSGPPHSPKKKDFQIDVVLNCGEEYPGEYEGEEFSCDTKGNIKNSMGDFVLDNSNLSDKILSIKGPGVFRVTPEKNYVLISRKINQDEWQTIFIDQLSKPLEVENKQYRSPDDQDWLDKLQTGDKYPVFSAPVLQLKFSQKGGGKICFQKGNTTFFARTANRAKDKNAGIEADNLLNEVKVMLQLGFKITKFEINELNSAVCRMRGKMLFIYQLKTNLEFPHDLQEKNNKN